MKDLVMLLPWLIPVGVMGAVGFGIWLISGTTHYKGDYEEHQNEFWKNPR